MTLVSLVVLLSSTSILFLMDRIKNPPRSCHANLKMMGQVLRMYAMLQPRELYPPMMAYTYFPVLFEQGPRVTYSRVTYSTANLSGLGMPLITTPLDFTYGRSKSEDEMFTDLSKLYQYNGWVCFGPRRNASDHDLTRLLEPNQLTVAMKAVLDAANKSKSELVAVVDADLPLAPELAIPREFYFTLPRLRSGVERFFNGVNGPPQYGPNRQYQPAADIWVMHDRVFVDSKDYWHQPAGGHVLYLDGHVEYHVYTGTFRDIPPISRETAEAYAVIDPIRFVPN